jgi:DNA-binding IclR family transcriptional regulator
MTDTATQEAPAERRGPGRPRIPAVIERDDGVLQYLKDHGGSAQVREIAEAQGIPKNLTYLSLWRLRKQGLVVYARDGANRTWSQT